MTTKRHSSYDFAIKHFNEPVIDYLRVVRLVGWGEDEHDAHYIYSCTRRGIYRSSAVGSFIPLISLKTQDTVDGIRHVMENPALDDFDQLDKWLSLNGAPRLAVFILEEMSAENVTADG